MGADVSVIMEDTDRMLREALLPHEQTLTSAGGHQLEVMGDVVVNLAKSDGMETIAVLSVSNGAWINLLGRPEIAALGMVAVMGSVSTEFPAFFKGLEWMNASFCIQVREGACRIEWMSLRSWLWDSGRLQRWSWSRSWIWG